MLRLYLAWPNRFETDPVDEPQLFFEWLQDNYGEMGVVSSLKSPSDVAAFLSSNPEVIEAAKFLKPSDSDGGQDVRREKRVRITTHVFIGVFECSSDLSLIGHAQKGIAFDVTPTGLGVEISEPLPTKTILNVTVAPAGFPIVLYKMTGEVRWARETLGRHQIGIKLFSVDDADRWQEDFDRRFHIV